LRIHVLRILAFLLVCVAAVPCRAQDKVTILYDAFGESKELTKDWGYSALVEHNGKRILFDTGNDAVKFEHNVKALGVDLTKLDFVVISHRHTDHTEGYNLKKNKWAELAADPTPRQAACFAAVKGLLYVAGGYDGSVLTLTP
jgi:glyoxylase-like metal-dependent hydrolase (beta-lactamase superfamily II)